MTFKFKYIDSGRWHMVNGCARKIRLIKVEPKPELTLMQRFHLHLKSVDMNDVRDELLTEYLNTVVFK